jgi:hypothetical protein
VDRVAADLVASLIDQPLSYLDAVDNIDDQLESVRPILENLPTVIGRGNVLVGNGVKPSKLMTMGMVGATPGLRPPGGVWVIPRKVTLAGEYRETTRLGRNNVTEPGFRFKELFEGRSTNNFHICVSLDDLSRQAANLWLDGMNYPRVSEC